MDNGIDNANSSLERSDFGTQPLGKRFKWVKGFFYATAIGDLLMIIGSLLIFTVDFSTYNPEFDISFADWFIIGGAGIYTLAFISSVISFSMFSHRAMKNLHILKSTKAEMSPGWTVGWYFIPFANLWKPFQAMSQIWDGSEEVSASERKTYPNLGAWWFCWVVTNISANISTRMAFSGTLTESSLKTSAGIDIVSSATGIAAIFLLLPILKMITDMQDNRLRGNLFD